MVAAGRGAPRPAGPGLRARLGLAPAARRSRTSSPGRDGSVTVLWTSTREPRLDTPSGRRRLGAREDAPGRAPTRSRAGRRTGRRRRRGLDRAVQRHGASVRAGGVQAAWPELECPRARELRAAERHRRRAGRPARQRLHRGLDRDRPAGRGPRRRPHGGRGRRLGQPSRSRSPTYLPTARAALRQRELPGPRRRRGRAARRRLGAGARPSDRGWPPSPRACAPRAATGAGRDRGRAGRQRRLPAGRPHRERGGRWPPGSPAT